MKLTLRVLLAVFMSMVCMSAKYEGLKEDVAINNRKERFGVGIAKKYNMEFLLVGGQPLIGNQKTRWAVSLLNRNQLTLEQARPLVKNIICEFIYEIKTQPVYRQWMLFMKKEYSKWDTDINSSKLGFKIGFWNQNVDRPLAPYLAHILVADRTVKYYYADPNTQALQEPPIEETFDQLGIPDFQHRFYNGKWVEN